MYNQLSIKRAQSLYNYFFTTMHKETGAEWVALDRVKSKEHMDSSNCVAILFHLIRTDL